MVASQTSQLAKLGPREAILAMLRCPDSQGSGGSQNWNAPIEGKTRIVKELFLMSVETGSGPESLTFPFTPGPYGPSSFDLTNVLDSMIRTGEISAVPLPSGRGVMLRLYGRTGAEAEAVWSRLSPKLQQDLIKIKSRFNATPYKMLLYRVYKSYPEFTTNSLIRDEILSEQQ